MRVVHGAPELHGAVERAAAAVLLQQDSDGVAETKTPAEGRKGVDSGVFWTLDLPEGVLEADKRSQVQLQCFFS